MSQKIAQTLVGARVAVLWVEGGAQPELEKALDISDSYPTAAIVSVSKKLAAPYRGRWDESKLLKFANPASKYDGLGGLKGDTTIVTSDKWDGGEAEAVEEEFSLDDLMKDEL